MDRIYFGIRMSLAIGGRLSKQSDPLAHENSNEVWMSRRDYLSKKEPQGLEPCGFY
jgi:hypothetical protein